MNDTLADTLPHPTTKGRKFFYGLLFVFGILAFYLIKDFWRELLFALTTALILHPYYLFLQKKFKLNSKVANIIVIISAVLFIFIPITVVSYMVLKDAFALREAIGKDFNIGDINMDLILLQINQFLASVPLIEYQISLTEFNEGLKNILDLTTNFIIKFTTGILGSAANIFISLIIYMTTLMFLFSKLNIFFNYIRDLSPLDNSVDEYFLAKAKSMTMDMLKGTFVIGLVQSTVGAILLWLCGVPYVLTLTVLMLLFSMIPIIGTTVVTIPIGIILVLTGNVFNGVVIILVQTLFIGNIDNVLRPMLVSNEARLHPALVILGVLGGLKVMGVLGVIYGPVIMILFVTAMEIYKKYYRAK